jgi:iron-sulfur cluster assembly protein
MDSVVSITEKAAAQIKIVQEREGKVGHALRVSVMGGGCSGLSYKLSFDEKPSEKDRLLELFGVQVVVDPKSALFLKGTVLEFTDGLNGQGFVFQNPNAKQSCGCGSSFSA